MNLNNQRVIFYLSNVIFYKGIEKDLKEIKDTLKE